MRTIFGLARRLAHAMHLISGILLVLMVMTVLLDVLGRFIFGVTSGAVDMTFPGGVEIVSMCLLFMVLFALPYSVNRGQVVVDLFTENLPGRVKSLLSGVYLIGFGLLGCGMAVRFYEAIWSAMESGETSQDLLIPLYYFYAIAAIATAILGLRGLLVALEHIFGMRSPS
ncbi:MAG: TRAP transporter small permease [Hyphomicrobiales bacterium]|nr:MAG: TRAP transporter small permease [Hyphomicrobiales bacterium]